MSPRLTAQLFMLRQADLYLYAASLSGIECRTAPELVLCWVVEHENFATVVGQTAKRLGSAAKTVAEQTVETTGSAVELAGE